MKQFFSKENHKKFKELFNIREKASEIENDLYKKTYKYINYIKWIPGIKMIGIGNSISMNSASKESDIDLYIVTNNNRIRFVRFLISLIFKILGVKKNNKKHAGRFCLSFFSTIDGIDFSSFKIENDIYLYFWIVYFKPILDFDNTYELFIEKNKSWADFSLYKDIIKNNKKYIKYNKQKQLPINKNLLDFLEKLIKGFFLKKTLNTYKKIGKPYGIIISNDLLKFHNNDIRKEISKSFK